jgi:hypothetical protein
VAAGAYTLKATSYAATGATGAVVATQAFAFEVQASAPTISIADATMVQEGEGAVFLVNLSGAAGSPVTVTYGTTDGSAVSPDDFAAVAGQAVIIAAGQTSATITIPTINDMIAEGAEAFTVQISASLAGVPLTATKATATATIAASDGGTTPGAGSTAAAIAASADDFETTGGVGSNDLEFGTQGGNPNTVALRFTGLDLPATADIVSAYLVFQAEASNAGATNLQIELQASSAAASYSTAANLNARSYLPTAVAWSDVAPWLANETYQSPDLSALIETLVGQDGLDITDALGFRITGTGLRQAYSFDSAGTEPRLVINYVDDAVL